jgi:UDP-glucose:glycoprotein glucosyltransferase
MILLLTSNRETAAEENSTAYFPLLDRIAGGHFQSANSDAELYDRFLEVLQQDGHITKPEALSTFKLALSLRAAAPRIEAHYQYYTTAVDSVSKGDTNEDCSTWALLDSKKYCSETLDKAVEGDLSAR